MADPDQVNIELSNSAKIADNELLKPAGQDESSMPIDDDTVPAEEVGGIHRAGQGMTSARKNALSDRNAEAEGNGDADATNANATVVEPTAATAEAKPAGSPEQAAIVEEAPDKDDK